MILTADKFGESKAAKTIITHEQRIHAMLDDKFRKGIIDAELYNKAISQLYGNIEKGDIMDKFGYGYGGSSNEPLKFTKTGKELKEMLPKVIDKLKEKRSDLIGKMSAFKTLAGMEPDEKVYDKYFRYSSNHCYAPYDSTTKSYGETTDQMRACQAYNDCCYQCKSIDEDIRACEVIMVSADDKQKYNLSISQMIALNLDGALSKAEGNDLEKASTGEGSRGGVIVGHTKSGNPIYDSSLTKKKLNEEVKSAASDDNHGYVVKQMGNSGWAIGIMQNGEFMNLSDKPFKTEAGAKASLKKLIDKRKK